MRAHVRAHSYARRGWWFVQKGGREAAEGAGREGEAAAGGLWQSTQGLEAKRLIPQEALHPVLIRREFYERFERYCACMRQHTCMYPREYVGLCIGEILVGRERDLEQGALCRAGWRSWMMVENARWRWSGWVPGWNASTGTNREAELRGKSSILSPNFLSVKFPSIPRDNHQSQSIRYFLVDELDWRASGRFLVSIY